MLFHFKKTCLVGVRSLDQMIYMLFVFSVMMYVVLYHIRSVYNGTFIH